MGIFDLPATIDHILQKTNQGELSLVGHSMGCLVSYVLLSSKPEYNKKVKINVSLAPTAIFTNSLKGPILPLLIRHGNVLRVVSEFFFLL